MFQGGELNKQCLLPFRSLNLLEIYRRSYIRGHFIKYIKRASASFLNVLLSYDFLMGFNRCNINVLSRNTEVWSYDFYNTTLSTGSNMTLTRIGSGAVLKFVMNTSLTSKRLHFAS